MYWNKENGRKKEFETISRISCVLARRTRNSRARALFMTFVLVATLFTALLITAPSANAASPPSSVYGWAGYDGNQSIYLTTYINSDSAYYPTANHSSLAVQSANTENPKNAVAIGVGVSFPSTNGLYQKYAEYFDTSVGPNGAMRIFLPVTAVGASNWTDSWGTLLYLPWWIKHSIDYQQLSIEIPKDYPSAHTTLDTTYQSGINVSSTYETGDSTSASYWNMMWYLLGFLPGKFGEVISTLAYEQGLYNTAGIVQTSNTGMTGAGNFTGAEFGMENMQTTTYNDYIGSSKGYDTYGVATIYEITIGARDFHNSSQITIGASNIERKTSLDLSTTLYTGAYSGLGINLTPAYTLIGKVVDSAGNPIRNATLLLQGPMNKYYIHSNEAGSYRFFANPSRNYTLEVCGDPATATTIVPDGRVSGHYYNFTGIPTTSVAGKVVDQYGQNIQGAQVKIRRFKNPGEPDYENTVYTDASGWYTFNQITQTGKYSVTATFQNRIDTTYISISSVDPSKEYYATTLSCNPGLNAFAPVTIKNSQSSATQNPFNMKVTVNSNTYSQYEASNLQNVEWITEGGTVIPSWIESGASSTSRNTVYWLKLPLSLGSASSSTSTNIIYIAFANKTTNLFSRNGSEGEAPALSPSYGEYDNGAVVFPFYDNFAGTALSNQWSTGITGGCVTVNNGITFTSNEAASHNEIMTRNTLSSGLIVETNITSISIPEGSPSLYADGLSTSNTGHAVGQGGAYVYDYSYFLRYHNTSSDNPVLMSDSSGSWTNIAASSHLTGIIGLSWPSLANEYTYYSETPDLTEHDSSLWCQPSQYLWMGASSGGDGSITWHAQWVRARSSLPDSVMPSASFGSIQTGYPMPIYLTVPTYSVTFKESGLPSGTTWTMGLGMNSESSSGTSITFNFVGDGVSNYYSAYSVTINNTSGYSSVSSGTIYENTTSVSDVTKNIVYNYYNGGYGGNGTQGCVLGSTPVLLVNGTYESARNLTTGTYVLTYNISTGTYMQSEILNVSVSSHSRMYTINGNIMVSGYQPVLTKHGYIEAQNLTSNDWLYDALTSSYVKISNITLQYGNYTMYDFVIPPNHDYIAGSYVVFDVTRVQ